MGLLTRLFGKGKEAAAAAPRSPRAGQKPVLRMDAVATPFSIGHLAYARDGSALVASGNKVRTEAGALVEFSVTGSVGILDARSFAVTQSLDTGGMPGAVGYMSDGKSVVGVVRACLRRWNVKTGKLITTIDTEIERASISEDGTAALVSKRDESVWTIDLLAGTKSGPYAPANGQLVSVDPRQQFVVRVEDGRVTLSNLVTATHEVLGAWKGQSVSAASLSPDGSILAVGSDEGVVALWKLGDRAKLFENDFCKGRINTFCFTPDGSFLVYAGVDGALCFASIATCDIEVTVNAHAEPILAAACSPDGGTLVTSGLSGNVKVWSLPRAEHAPATPPVVPERPPVTEPPSVGRAPQETDCICILPKRFCADISDATRHRVLTTCAMFVGNQITPRYRIDARHRTVSIFTDDPAFGAGVGFTWVVSEDIRQRVVADTKKEWQDLMSQIDQHGIDALLAAGGE